MIVYLTDEYPTPYKSFLTLKNSREILLRPIMPTDDRLVIDFFEKLSPETLYLRFLNQVRVLPKDLLHQLIHINYKSEFALVGIIKEGGKDAIVAIARYAYSSHYNITDLAVAVRDDWQHLGIGKPLLKKVVDFGRENGISCFDGIIHPENRVIMRILTELGYQVKYFSNNGLFQVKIFV